jgi:hypothetical protein
MIQELESVILTTDLPAHGLKAGDIGAVVTVYPQQNAYEVEFVALNGETLALVTLLAEQVRQIKPREIAHVRAVERFSPSPSPILSATDALNG